MRGILKFVAVVALMVAARYAPLGGTAGQMPGPAQPPAIVTGSVQGDARPAGTNATLVRPKRDAAAEVRTILAQATAERSSNGQQAQRRGGGKRGREDEVDDDGELYIGGTGLLDEEQTAAAEHPLAAKNPDDYLVICEAGCRPASDRIVYRVSKIAAVAAAKAQRKMEVSSADATSETSEIVCVAGCYDDAPVKRRHASGERQAAPVQLAQKDEPGSALPKQQQRDAQPVEQPQHTQAAAAVATANAKEPESKPATQIAGSTPSAKADAPAVITTASIPSPSVAAAVQTPAPTAPAVAAVTHGVSDAKREAPAAIAPVASTSLAQLAAVHAISAETAARLQAKQVPSVAAVKVPTSVASATAPQPASRWETKVTPLVVLQKSAPVRKSVVALGTVTPFQTSISVENGWDFTLSNTP